MEICLNGEASAVEIDDYVDRWHEGGSGVALHEFLGLTRDEYKSWVERPDSLVRVIDARKESGRSATPIPITG